MKNYGAKMCALTGLMRVDSTPSLLDFLMKAGIGNRRGQGFGMVELA